MSTDEVLALGGEEEFAPEGVEPALRPATARLRIEPEGGGLRQYLRKRDVHAGPGLNLWRDGTRTGGRYEWSYRERDEPTLHFLLAGGTAGRRACAVPSGFRTTRSSCWKGGQSERHD